MQIDSEEEKIVFPKLKFIRLDLEESNIPDILHKFLYDLSTYEKTTPKLSTMALHLTQTHREMKARSTKNKFLPTDLLKYTHATNMSLDFSDSSLSRPELSSILLSLADHSSKFTKFKINLSDNESLDDSVFENVYK